MKNVRDALIVILSDLEKYIYMYMYTLHAHTYIYIYSLAFTTSATAFG